MEDPEYKLNDTVLFKSFGEIEQGIIVACKWDDDVNGWYYTIKVYGKGDCSLTSGYIIKKL